MVRPADLGRNVARMSELRAVGPEFPLYGTLTLQGGRVANGVGADPDIVVASAKAYLSALNKLHSKTERVAAQG